MNSATTSHGRQRIEEADLPVYTFECKNGHRENVRVRFGEEEIDCKECKETAKHVFDAADFQFHIK